MLIAATAAAAVLVASSLAAGAAAPATYPALPPLIVNVTVAETISPSLVALTIGEADAIFRSAGVSFIWRYGPPAQTVLTALTVAIGDDSGSLRRDDVTALGWIVFEDGRPDQQIYLSHANAEKFMLDARAVVGLPNNMPRAERELLLGRAMGRALAHELGHYLLATKAHSDRGLMKAVRSAQEFFGSERVRFELDRLQRLQIASRLRADGAVASRQKPDGERRPGGTTQ
jgi:hypothetical protein